MEINREILPKILHWLDRNKIILIKGSRQVGKTTLLKMIQKKLEAQTKRTFYLSIDQEMGNPILDSSKNLLTFLKSKFGDFHSQNKLYLFLDEFQYLKNSGLFLKTLFDQSKDSLQIVVSGSSSLEITKNSEFLTGRKVEFYLPSLNYREFMAYKSGLNLGAPVKLKDFTALQEFYGLYKEYLNGHLPEYLTFGGYPEVVTTSTFEDKLTLLKEIVTTYIEKDIIAFLGVENVTAFRNLLKILSAQIGNLVNRSELSNTVGLSMDTLKKYLDILEGTYILNLVKPFFTNIRKELAKMPKIYISDLGLRSVVLNLFGNAEANAVSGAVRENFIYNDLRSKYDQDQVKFYRTISKAEIDFIIQTSNFSLPIEVKSIHKQIAIPAIMRNFNKEYNRGKESDTDKSINIIISEDLLEQKDNSYFIPISLLPFVEFTFSFLKVP